MGKCFIIVFLLMMSCAVSAGKDKARVYWLRLIISMDQVDHCLQCEIKTGTMELFLSIKTTGN